MDETMIERVAAVFRRANETGGQFDYFKVARAAIEAMREPTQEMVNLRQSYRFVENDGEGGAWIDEEGATAFWQAMIDKALTP